MSVVESEIVKTAPKKRRKPLPILPPAPKWNYHRARMWIHWACFAVFVALPFFNVMRFDLPRQRFYFAGQELWISEFGIIFLTMMFLLFTVAAAAMYYGRVYCGYLCPQMIFSEAADAIQHKTQDFINRRFTKWPKARRANVGRALMYAGLLVMSVLLAFVFISYFVPPRDLFWRLASMDVKTAGGFAGAVVTLLAFLDFAFLRQRFCTTICPYGYLQGMLGDKQTLLVHYRDPEGECIECKKCVRVCPMDIDIRDSPFQIQCIHCGECVDACADIMRRFGRPTLIHYAWGEQGEVLTAQTPWHKRLGLRDAKRVVILFVMLFYALGLLTALSLRREVLVKIAPVRSTLYRVGNDGQIYNHFRLSVANRGKTDATLLLSANNLNQARFAPELSSTIVKTGETMNMEFDIAVPLGTNLPGVNHFQITASVGNITDKIDQTFITPMEKAK